MDTRHPQRFAACSHGRVAYREAGATGEGLPLVLLHGIGSGAASWAGQLDGLAAHHRVIAWDAPGYGDSAPLPSDTPLARDYAAVLGEFLARLEVEELVLVGHSLGALIAAAWAAAPTARLRALVLASPARGYGGAAPEVRQAKWRERIDAIERLGPQGLAEARAAALCAPDAAPEAIEQVRANMARVTPRGYAQAAHLLAHDELLAHLRRVRSPMAVLCGDLDQVTTADASAELADAVGAAFTRLDGVAHACYVEQPQRFNAALGAAIAALTGNPR